ncbi:MAG: DUF2283 domain-containing protein [Chloroflexi bacterium]|nr:MAG: DUF2283 domain-containing protein [Chloroflexota bacterium]
MNRPILNYDQENDILYIVLREGEEDHFEEVTENILVEFDRNNQPIGIEIFNALQLITATLGREQLALAFS